MNRNLRIITKKNVDIAFPFFYWSGAPLKFGGYHQSCERDVQVKAIVILAHIIFSPDPG